MVIHNVYFWLKSETSEEEKKGFEQGIKDFLSAVEEVVKYEIGIPAGTPKRDVVDHSFGYSIFVWFNTVEDHNTYQTHPAHEVFIRDFNQLWAKVQVKDSSVDL